MANPRPSPKPKSKSQDLVVYAAGAAIVVALLAFSLSRATRKPSASPSVVAATQTETSLSSSPSPSTAPGQDQAPVPSLPPVASPRTGALAPLSTQPPIASAEPVQPQLASVPRTKVGELFQLIESKQVTIIDVRDADSYRARHIPGALHIPLAYIAGEVSYLPKDKPIVTYCT